MRLGQRGGAGGHDGCQCWGIGGGVGMSCTGIVAKYHNGSSLVKASTKLLASFGGELAFNKLLASFGDELPVCH